MTPDVKLSGRKPDAGVDSTGDGNGDQDPANKSDLLDDEEDFFDFITRFQSKRMDDQRCSLADNRQEDPAPAPTWSCSLIISSIVSRGTAISISSYLPAL